MPLAYNIGRQCRPKIWLEQAVFSIKHSIILQESECDTFVGRDFGFGVSVYHIIENNPINKPFFQESDSVYQNTGR